MESLQEAKAYVKGKKESAVVIAWEIIPVPSFTAKDIKRIREKVGLSQPLFAELLGISVKTVRSWEQGIASPSKASSRLLESLDKARDKMLSLYQEIHVINRKVAGKFQPS